MAIPRIFGGPARRLPPLHPVRQPEPARPPAPAALELMAEGERFDDTPLGGYAGEMLPVPEPAPQAPAAAGLVIEPWPEEERRRAMQEADPSPPPEPRLRPVDQMILDNDGYQPHEYGLPPAPLPPLQRPEVPPVDWELELEERAELERVERERIARERRAELLRELLAEDTSAYPKRGKS